MMYKIVHGLAPSYLTDMFTEQKGSKIYDLRESKLSLEIPPARIPPCLEIALHLQGP